MTTAVRVWPSGDAYQNAVLSPRRFLKDERLHATQVESKFFLGSQRPHLRSGNFGAVYKFRNKQKAFALKVFYKIDPDRHTRYQIIHEHLTRYPKSAHLVSFQYQEDGILVNGKWYPTLVMDWVHGRPLDLFLQEGLPDLANGSLCSGWLNLMEGLQSRSVAHGDLQHGNVLVLPNGHFQLVDYDGMFVSPMSARRLHAAECGLAAYQHPGRENNRHYFNEHIDDFSALVILLTLAAITPELWKEFHNDDNCLLFRKADFVAPHKSALFAELLRSQDMAVRKLATVLKSAACGDIDSVPHFRDVARDPVLRPLWTSQWRPTARKPTPIVVTEKTSPTTNPSANKMPAWLEPHFHHKASPRREVAAKRLTAKPSQASAATYFGQQRHLPQHVVVPEKGRISTATGGRLWLSFLSMMLLIAFLLLVLPMRQPREQPRRERSALPGLSIPARGNDTAERK